MPAVPQQIRPALAVGECKAIKQLESRVSDVSNTPVCGAADAGARVRLKKPGVRVHHLAGGE